MPDEPKKACPSGDELKVGPDMGGQVRPFVRHTADHEIKFGVMRPVAEGEPLTGNEFMVEPKDPEHGIYSVKQLDLPKPGSGMAHSGPALANSREFKDGWERTFGGKPRTVGSA
jgi:hypothetical protein